MSLYQEGSNATSTQHGTQAQMSRMGTETSKTDFTKVLWTNEMTVSLDGPNGWASRWAPSIISDEFIVPLQLCAKIHSKIYCQFLEDTFFKHWYKKSAACKISMILMHQSIPYIG